MSLAHRLSLLHDHALAHCPALPEPFPAHTLIFSVSDGKERADTLHACGAAFGACWKDGLVRLRRRMERRGLQGRFLRVDWVKSVQGPFSGEEFANFLGRIKRNYCRCGITFSPDFAVLLTEEECNANAVFYSQDNDFACFNSANFAKLMEARFPGRTIGLDGPDTRVWLTESAGAFCGEDQVLHPLPGLLPGDPVTAGLYTGHRETGKLTPELLDETIAGGARWLARQIEKNGRYVYGRLPCSGGRLTSYNALRHASSTYALLEYLEYSGDALVREPAQRALRCLTDTLVREYGLASGGRAAFLIDEKSGEIRLGGNGLALLALAKWRDITGTDEHLPIMEMLADGIAHMQDAETGSFVHVLHADDLSLKEKKRVIYYDGEAVFGLLRLYRHTGAGARLETAKKSFDSFLHDEHAKAHDHWLSYSANEITAYLPEERYFNFGIANACGWLDFILKRETTYPTMLELMMAAKNMLTRLAAAPELRRLIDGVDMERFKRALHYRAHYLLNGFFWPEMAMFFKYPDTIAGTFFIRHHAFRVRIDDVEHYLSGLIAYSRMLKENDPVWAAPENARLFGTRVETLHAE